MPASVGSLGYFQYELESVPGGAGTPGTFVTPDKVYFAESSALTAKPTMQKRAVFGGRQDANRVRRITTYTIGGAVSGGLYPNQGADLLVAGIGTDTYLSAVTADTLSVDAVTTGGATTLVLTTGGGAYLPGAFLDVGAGGTLERVIIISWNSGTKTLVTSQCAFAHASTAAVQQKAQHQITPYTATSGFANRRRTISAEMNQGGLYSWKYPYLYVDKLELKMTGGKVDATWNLVGNKDRTLSTSPTALNEGDANISDLPFELLDSFLVTGNDQFASGSSVVQTAPDLEEVTLTWDSKFLSKYVPGSKVMRQFVGAERTVSCDFKVINEANRPALFQDILKSDTNTAFIAGFVQGSNAISIHLPNIRHEEADDTGPVGDVLMETVKSEAIAVGSQVVGEVFLINSAVAAY